MVLYTKSVCTKIRGHHTYVDLDVYKVKVILGTCSGMHYGSGAPKFVKHSARYWLVKEEFETEKVTPHREEEDNKGDPAKLIGTALFK